MKRSIPHATLNIALTACSVTDVAPPPKTPPPAYTVGDIQPRKPRIVEIAGQSNAVGLSVLPTDTPPSPGYLIQQVATRADPIDWLALTGPIIPRPVGTTWSRAGGAGVEISLAQTLNDPTLTIVKFAVGATGLDAEWRPGGGYPSLPAGGPDLFAQLDAFTTFPDVFVWIQGERDARYLPYAERYGADLETFVDTLRANHGPFLFVFNRLAADVNIPGGGVDVVRAQQEAYAATCDACVMIDGDDLPLQVDGVHFTVEGYSELGKRIALAVGGTP